jgi:putative nucleotidyltransferase with HDIG domain
VAEALSRGVREHDSVFRVGGEEFAVLLPGVTAEEAQPVAERLREAVARTPFALPLRVSIGLAAWPADAVDRDALLERADAALYAAKRGGKDRVAAASDRADVAGGGAGAGRTSLLDVLRSKDARTMAHGARVATLAIDVARALGLDAARLEDLRIAGQLHDVGNLAVPDSILNKPGALDDSEMRVVRTHPVVGAELVRAWGFPGAARFVLEHHEQVDGRGYPAGLAGDDIAIEARIVHVVDAFSAMTSDRPYRAAMSAEEAFAELRRLAGSQFDADVVAALEQACPRLEPPEWTVETVAGPQLDRR